MSAGEVLATILILIAGYQIYVTVRVVKSDKYTKGQRTAQTLLIWFVPVLGAVVCHLVLTTRVAPGPKRDPAFIQDPGNNPPGMPGGPSAT